MARWDTQDTNTIPQWFFEAVETEPDSRSIAVDDCDVMYRRYGDKTKPGMLLVHGMHAHSRWWDFIAPQLTDDFCVAAMDLTGMGDSDYRYEYRGDVFAQEIKAVCEHAGFDDQVILVAHSFGGAMAVKAANLFPQCFGRLVLVDSGIRHPDEPEPERPSMMSGRSKVYPDRKAAESRFRLQPPQDCANRYVIEYIAKQSLMPADGGWAWKFDDDLPMTLVGVDRTPEDFQNLKLPLGVIYGDSSDSFTAKTLEYMRELIPQSFPAIEVKDAQHHVFLDQPLEFVRALREILPQVAPAVHN